MNLYENLIIRYEGTNRIYKIIYIIFAAFGINKICEADLFLGVLYIFCHIIEFNPAKYVWANLFSPLITTICQNFVAHGIELPAATLARCPSELELCGRSFSDVLIQGRFPGMDDAIPWISYYMNKKSWFAATVVVRKSDSEMQRGMG